MATGRIGRPDWRATMTMPSPARRASPPGTSAVMATVRPSRSDCTAARKAWVPPRSLAREPAPAPRISCMSKCLSVWPRSLGVAVPGQHDIHRDVRQPDQRQQHELAVPHADDAGVVALWSSNDSVISRVCQRGARDEADVAGEQRAGRDVIEFGLARDVRHPGRTWCPLRIRRLARSRSEGHSITSLRSDPESLSNTSSQIAKLASLPPRLELRKHRRLHHKRRCVGIGTAQTDPGGSMQRRVDVGRYQP